jgi:nucleoporin NDC1
MLILCNQPVSVAAQTADPIVTLISGMTSPDLFYAYLACHELREFSSDDAEISSTRRTAMFADQKYNPTLWSTFVNRSLEILESDHQVLLRRGKQAPAPAPGKRLSIISRAMCVNWMHSTYVASTETQDT